MTAQEYTENPCGMLSIPYWKNKHITIPADLRVVHGSDYSQTDYSAYHDEPYFRLFHDLRTIQKCKAEHISIRTASKGDIPMIADVINRSYTDLSVTIEQLHEYTETEVYHPSLWVMAVDEVTSDVVGCGIADFDKEIREGILEWIQVIPPYRGRNIGQLLVNELLSRMVGVAEFATVSGRCNNKTNPEKLYRKCGFTGEDVWHVLRK